MARTRQFVVGIAAFSVLTALASSTASAQPLQQILGDDDFEQFGWSCGGGGDVNNDGTLDWVAGSPLDGQAGNNAGIVRVVSGATGTVIFTLLGEAAHDEFGTSCAIVGDINGNGHADVLIGAPRAGGAGKAYLNDGLGITNGNPVPQIFNGDEFGDRFGFAVNGAGDIDDQGRPDFIVGAPEGGFTPYQGYARIFRGENRAVLITLYGDRSGDFFGCAVDKAGNTNNDDFLDVIIGAKMADGEIEVPGGFPFPNPPQPVPDVGEAYVFSGEWITKTANAQNPVTNRVLFKFQGDNLYDQVGFSVSEAGDDDNDGLDEVIVGAPFNDNGGGAAGSVFFLEQSGDTFHLLKELHGAHGGSHFGWSLDFAGDVNGDGRPDVVIGVPYANTDEFHRNAGCAETWAGGELLVLHGQVCGSEQGDILGYSVAGVLDDLGSDNRSDIVVGVIGYDEDLPMDGDDEVDLNIGAARVYSGVAGGMLLAYGNGFAGSMGHVPSLEMTGSASPGGILQVRIDEGLGGAPAFLFLGLNQAAIPIPGCAGCKVHVDPLLVVVGPLMLSTGVPGEGELSFEVPIAETVPPGTRGTVQAFISDSGGQISFAGTNGVEIVVQ